MPSSSENTQQSNNEDTFGIDPTILSGIGLVFENVIIKALKYDPGTKNSLAALAPLNIHIETSAPNFHLIFRIKENTELSVGLHQEKNFSSSENIDIHLSGKFSDFISLATSKDHMLAKHNISVSGKIHQLGQLQEIANNLDIDWEEPIVALLGVVPGHFISEKIRTAARWATHQQKEIKHWLPETLQEELKLVPSRPEVEQFFNSIDTLSAVTQRLEARVNRLRQKLESQ